MINSSNKKVIKNNVINRFLPIPESVLKGLEPEPKITDFTLIREIGVGSFGRVLLVMHNKTQAQYAVKAIDKRIKDNIEEKPYFRREMEIMYRINHPNVVKLFGHFEDNTFCYFLMEYIPRGNLFSLVPKNGYFFISDQTAASLVKDVISALYYLHHLNPPIIHRDIKPENILINEQMRAKLSDFGWSNYLNGIYKRSTICGTPIYLAPEIINDIGHDEKIDIWGVGVLLFELLTGEAPWEGSDVNTVKKNIIKLNIKWPKKMDPDAKDLISKILRYTPEERPSLRYILNHRFFKKFFPDADKCLKAPNSSDHKVYLISKDTPSTYYMNQNYNQEINDLAPRSSLPIAFESTNTNEEYLKTTATTYNANPLNSSNFPKTEFNNIKTNDYITISPSLINSISNQQANTFTVTPLNNNNYSRQTFTMENNLLLQQYNNGTKLNGYSLVPSNNLNLKEIQENQERINELVRKSNAGKYDDNNYRNRQFGLKKPPYYSEKTLMDIADIISNKNLYSTMTNKDLLNFNPKNIRYYNSNYFKPDPEVLKWNQQQNMRRESEKLKLSSLYNKFGMTLYPTSKNRYFV